MKFFYCDDNSLFRHDQNNNGNPLNQVLWLVSMDVTE